MRYILAIELGTSGPKVALFSTEGERFGSEFEPAGLLLSPGGGAEQSPNEWWEAIGKAVKRLLARGLAPAGDIMAVACPGQWSGTVPVDAGGRALANAVIWMDARGAPAVRRILDGPLSIRGYAPTRIIPWIRRTGGIPGRAGKDPIAHILYLKETRPDLYRKTHMFLEPVDYIGLRLTGRFAASFASITLHWVTDNREIARVTYDRKLLDLSTIDPAKLPALQPVDAILGGLRPEIAREWGLGRHVQVTMGSPDVHSATVGSGAVGDGEPHLYIGTSSWITCHVPAKKTDVLHNLAAIPSAIPGRYLLANEQECAGACLQFLRDNLWFHADELSSGGAPPDVYGLFDRIAARTPAGSDKVIFTPWLYGERSPMDDPDVRGGFLNLSLRTTREHLVRAVLEGVAFNARWLLEHVERFIGRKVDAIHMAGGGAKSDIWCQIHADVLDRPIRQVQHPIDVNLRGAAFLASAALGYIPYDAIGSRVPISAVYTPDPGHRRIYDELFQAFVSVYGSNRRMFARLNRSA